MYTSTYYLHTKVLPVICLSWKKCQCCLSLTDWYCTLNVIVNSFLGKALKKYFQVKFRWQTSDPLITVNCFDLPLILFLFYFVRTTNMAINSSNYIIIATPFLEQVSRRWNSAFNKPCCTLSMYVYPKLLATNYNATFLSRSTSVGVIFSRWSSWIIGLGHCWRICSVTHINSFVWNWDTGKLIIEKYYTSAKYYNNY